MTLHFTLTWGHARSDALSEMHVSLTGGGATLTSQRAGRMVWTLPGPGEVRLQVNVGSTRVGTVNRRGEVRDRNISSCLVETHPVQIDQTMSLAAETGVTFVSTRPDHPPRDPRCVRSVHRGAAPHADISLHVDLAFYDVTDRIGPVRSHLRLAQDRQLRAFADASESEDGRLRILQHTGGAPHLWAVYVPPFIPSEIAEVDVLVFIGPVNPDKGNVHLGAADTGSAIRYLTAPDSLPLWGSPYRHETAWWWNWWPRCGYMDQIRAANRKVVFAMPFYSGASYGVVEHAGLGGLIESMLIAMASGAFAPGSAEPRRLIGTSDVGVSLRRLGLSGYSFGGGVALRSWAHNRARIDELYILDPAGGSPYELRAQLGAWAHHDPAHGDQPRKLRFIGGDFLHEMRAARLHPATSAEGTTLVTSDSITVWPASASFFRTSRVYADSFTTDEDTPHTTVLSDWDVEANAPAEPQSHLSRATHVYRDPEQSTDRSQRVHMVLDNGVAVGPLPIGPHALVEASSYVGIGRGHFINDVERIQILRPLTTAAQARSFARWLRDFMPDGYPRRHQWPAYGGQSTDDDPASRKGYLQLCLENSGFAE